MNASLPLAEKARPRECDWVASFRAGRGLRIESGAGTIAEGSAWRVLAAGRSTPGEALAACETLGAAAPLPLRGEIALLACERATGRLIAARDPLGLHPLFWAPAAGSAFFSPSAAALADALGDAAARPNRAALADHLRQRWPRIDETYFAGIRRLEPGKVLRIDGRGGIAIEEGPSPMPAGRPIEWLDAPALGGFADALERAVGRSLPEPGGRAAIFLSGGIDSASVAVAAAALLRERGGAPIVALALAFPAPASEVEAQRRLADRLGFELVIETIDEAVGPDGLLAAAAAESGRRAAPLLNLWEPAYARLAERARALGCSVILTGNGGDEWLEAGPLHAADLVRRADVAGLFRLWRTACRSYPLSSWAAARSVLWRFGLGPVLHRAAVGAAETWAPKRLAHVRRRRAERRLPSWLAPDPALARELGERDHLSRWIPGERGADGFYVSAMRRALALPVQALEHEEMFSSAGRWGLRLAHPYWDSELVERLCRTRPGDLNRGGRGKSPARAYLEEKLSGFGFGRQRKLLANNFYSTVVSEQGRPVWRALDGGRALAELGIVEPRRLQSHLETLLAGGTRHAADVFGIWSLISAAAWARARQEGRVYENYPTAS